MERGQGLAPWSRGGGCSDTRTKRSAGRRLAGLFHGRPRLQVGTLLAGPVGWLVVGYLGSLAVLLVTSFWTLGELSGEIEQTFTLDNFKDVVENAVYRTSPRARSLIAALVTVTDALLAFPIAFYMAKVAKPRTRGLLVVAVLVPLWSAYLVKVVRLARDPERGRGPQLGCSTRSGSRGPATASSPSGW